ncbi:MAG TPA: PAS domain-containing protein, partial [Pyrinomonadaceae bacterium]|nr:PAS domain-containing protein [Pyrinomonadaceae bacterium]
VETAPFNVLVLAGPSFLVESFSPGYARLFEGRDVLGRTVEEVFSGAAMDGFVEAVVEAYRRDKTLTTPPMPMSFGEARGGPAESLFVHTIVPVSDDDRQAGGVIVYSESRARGAPRDSESPNRGD